MIQHSQPTLGIEEKKACDAVLHSLNIAQGEKVREFEKGICALTGRRYGIAASSGTTALGLALQALGLKRHAEVILPSFTCAALLHAVDSVGAKPVPVDMDGEDLNISVDEVKKKIRKKTQAIIVPHLFGRAARIEEIARLGIPVIEDGTQALGAHAGGKPVGSFGVLSVFSFYATKMITTGEGGMVLTDSKKMAQKLFDSRDYDKKKTYQVRTNAKMTDIEAAIGLEQLKKLPSMIRARREIAACYHVALGESGVLLPASDEERDHVYYRYLIRVPKQALIWMRTLNSKGIEAKKPIFKALHRYLGYKDSGFPVTVRAGREACSLPIFPSLKSADCRKVCELVGVLAKRNTKRGKALAASGV